MQNSVTIKLHFLCRTHLILAGSAGNSLSGRNNLTGGRCKTHSLYDAFGYEIDLIKVHYIATG